MGKQIDKNVSFGEALIALEQGRYVTREGWNGKGLFLFMTSEKYIPTLDLYDPVFKTIAERNNLDTLHIRGHINMKAADNSIVIGWLASQTDMLAQDWEIYER